ncbi:MAG: zinc-ribbon domain-containing protein [Chloroflexota bacterium]
MTIILIAFMIVGAVAIVAYPLFKPSSELDAAFVGANDPVLEGLVSQRDAMYSAIKDLENDHATGKLSDADYRSLRTKYEAKAVAILQELDHAVGSKPGALRVRDDDAVEREIARLRRGAATNGVLKCPKCGTPHVAEDVFCAKCGASLRGTRCPACGKRAAVGDKFCGKCGKPL